MEECKEIPCCSGKAPPEAKKVAVCWDKLGDGAGTPPEAACGSTLTGFPCTVLGVDRARVFFGR